MVTIQEAIKESSHGMAISKHGFLYRREENGKISCFFIDKDGYLHTGSVLPMQLKSENSDYEPITAATYASKKMEMMRIRGDITFPEPVRKHWRKVIEANKNAMYIILGDNLHIRIWNHKSKQHPHMQKYGITLAFKRQMKQHDDYDLSREEVDDLLEANDIAAVNDWQPVKYC